MASPFTWRALVWCGMALVPIMQAVWEGGMLIVPPSFEVAKAWYGDPAHKWTKHRGKDVTSLVQNQNTPIRARFPDTAPGTRKVLFVKLAKVAEG